jgi:hypothetical protein
MYGKTEHFRGAAAARVAAVVLLGGFMVESTRLFTNHPWPGYAPWVSHTVSAMLASLWLITAGYLVFQSKNPWLSRAAWALSLVSGVILFCHPLILRVGGSALGLLYLVALALFAFAVKRSEVWRRSRYSGDDFPRRFA